MKKYNALLLLGPTGSAKTPLGDMLEARGLGPRRCVHFDFGANLRAVAALRAPDARFDGEDIRLVRDVLESGALLENDQFPLAEKVVRAYVEARAVGAEDLLVLNGLPRHVGQAEALSALVDVAMIVRLACDAGVIFSRIAANTGGDRDGRDDDDREAVRKRLDIFDRRTSALIEHYRRRGVPVQTVQVEAATTAEDMWRALVPPDAPG